MSEPVAEIQVTSFELAIGTIRSVTVTGDDGISRVLSVRVPPGTEDGAVLPVPTADGTSEVRVTTSSVAAPLAADPVAPPPVAPPPVAPPPVATPPVATPPVATLPEFASADFALAVPESAPTQDPAQSPLASDSPLPPPVASPPPLFATPPTPPPAWATPPAGMPITGYGPPVYRSSARSRRKVVLFTGITAAIVVLVVALITANSGRKGPTVSADPSSQQAAPPATTTQPPESVAGYQQALNGLATALNSGLTELNNAQTPTAISTAVTDLTNGVQQAQAAFGANPPANTSAANTALVTALQSLDSGFNSVDDAATGDEVCLGPAATALLSRQTSIDALRAAIGTLTGVSGGLGYQFGASIPAHTEDEARTAGTGTVVAGGVKHGLGELTVTNGGDTDATVALVKGQGAPLVTVYMGHGGSYTLHHIPDGTYTIYVTNGDDWDAGARLFSRNCQFDQFDQPMDFRTTSTEYTTYTITLTPAAGGDATLSGVDPGAFPH